MIIPVRCFTCGKVLADKWEFYNKKCKELEKQNVSGGGSQKKKEDDKEIPTSKYFTEPFKKEILDEIGLDRYCCRRHMLGHVDIIDNL